MLVGVVLGLGLVFAFALGPLLGALSSSLSQAGDTAAPAVAVLSPAGVIYFIISLVVNSLYTVFASIVWTLAYREWQQSE
jgi:hypothetical protein